MLTLSEYYNIIVDTKEQSEDFLNRRSDIIQELVLIELQALDPEYVSRYQRAKIQTTDLADSMRIDLALSDKLHKLRDEGKISPVSKLSEKAETMARMNPDELRKSLHDYSEEFSASVEKNP